MTRNLSNQIIVSNISPIFWSQMESINFFGATQEKKSFFDTMYNSYLGVELERKGKVPLDELLRGVKLPPPPEDLAILAI